MFEYLLAMFIKKWFAKSGWIIHWQAGPNPKHEIRNNFQITKFIMFQTKEFKEFKILDLFRNSIFGFRIYQLQTLFGSAMSV